jgi:hypothetical protein
MRHLKRHLERVSLEDAENNEADLTPKDPVVENVDSEPEEIENLAADLLVEPEPAGDSVRAEIVEVEDMCVAVEEFQALLGAAVQRGGMRAEEGIIVGTALKHFNKRLGIQGKETLGLEDFGGNMSRLKATQISQEAFADVAKAAAAKIKDLIAKLLAFLREKAAAFDAQGQKVKVIVGQIKQRVKTIVTGEIELEYQGNYIGERDILNAKTLAGAAVWAESLNSHMSSHLKATADVIKKLALSQGTAEDVAAFDKQIEGMWGLNTNPIATVMRVAKAVGYPLTQSKMAILTHKEGSSGTPVLSHSLEVKGDQAKPIKMSLTKGQYIALLDATEKMNNSVLSMSAAYAANSSVVMGMSISFRTQEAQTAADKVLSGLIALIEQDIYGVVKCIGAARGELGYICAIAAKKFGL